MIFGKGYDESLWLILAGDNRNRQRILEFIYAIPKEIIVEIRKDLKSYMLAKNKYPISENVFRTGSYSYSYSVTIGGKLLLCKAIEGNSNYDDVLILTLFPYDLLQFENCTKVKLGSLLYTFSAHVHNNIIDGDEIQYNLLKTPLGILLNTYQQYKMIIQRKFMMLDSNFTFDGCQFSDSITMSKLLKKRVRCLKGNRMGEKYDI